MVVYWGSVLALITYIVENITFVNIFVYFCDIVRGMKILKSCKTPDRLGVALVDGACVDAAHVVLHGGRLDYVGIAAALSYVGQPTRQLRGLWLLLNACYP